MSVLYKHVGRNLSTHFFTNQQQEKFSAFLILRFSLRVREFSSSLGKNVISVVITAVITASILQNGELCFTQTKVHFSIFYRLSLNLIYEAQFCLSVMYKTAWRTNIKLGTIDHLLGVSVIGDS